MPPYYIPFGPGLAHLPYYTVALCDVVSLAILPLDACLLFMYCCNRLQLLVYCLCLGRVNGFVTFLKILVVFSKPMSQQGFAS